MEQMDTEPSWKFFSDSLEEVVTDTIFVYKNPKTKPKPPWMDTYCLKLDKQKYKVWHSYTFSGKHIDY